MKKRLLAKTLNTDRLFFLPNLLFRIRLNKNNNEYKTNQRRFRKEK